MSTSFSSIEALTTAMAAGDAAAIEVFYRRYCDRMLSMARAAVPSRGRDEAFALDVLHDATLRIVRCIKAMHTEPHLMNWTRLVVQSCALDRLRKEQRARRRERSASRDESTTGGPSWTEEAAWLSAQISALDPHVAKLIQLRFVDGWTLARIASAYRTSTGKIDGQLRRAIERLRTGAKGVFDDR